MYSIYFNNRCLAVCSNYEQSLNDPDGVLYIPGSRQETSDISDISDLSDLPDLPALFQNSPQLTKLYVPSNHEEVTFKQLCTKLTPIQAGGGLVTNSKGEYLLIFRHGVWDLPKGKQEENEDIRQAALREVEEECGVHDLKINEHICDTYHTYQLNDKFMLKCTHWYKMEYLGNGLDTAPQIEENIERAVWVKKEELPKYLTHTYPSILDVFRAHGMVLPRS